MNARDWVLKGTSYKGQRLAQLLKCISASSTRARSQVLAVGCLAPAWHMPTNVSCASLRDTLLSNLQPGLTWVGAPGCAFARDLCAPCGLDGRVEAVDGANASQVAARIGLSNALETFFLSSARIQLLLCGDCPSLLQPSQIGANSAPNDRSADGTLLEARVATLADGEMPARHEHHFPRRTHAHDAHVVLRAAGVCLQL